MAHYCNPNLCHRCPDLEGDIMPGCMGTAARAHGPRDISFCTCTRREKRDGSELAAIRREIKKLRKEIETLKLQVTK